MAFFTHHESPWECFYQGAYWILWWFNFWRVKQKWFLPKQRRNRFQVVNLQQFEIELVPYSLLTCILLEVECTCFDLIGVDDMEPATIQTRKPLLEVGTTTQKTIHEYRQCLFTFSWELQTSLSHWSMIFFLCVFFSAYPNSGKWVGETSGIFVVHVILVVAIVSWDPNSTVDLWMRFFERDTEMDSIYHFTCSIFERTKVFACVFSHAALQVE